MLTNCFYRHHVGQSCTKRYEFFDMSLGLNNFRRQRVSLSRLDVILFCRFI